MNAFSASEADEAKSERDWKDYWADAVAVGGLIR